MDGGGMWIDHSGVWSRFGSECAISLLVVSDAVSLRHPGAGGFTVLVIRVLLAGRPPQTFIYLILIIRHGWVAAAQRRVLMILGDTS